jgi:DNA mismatch endonuclease (patch repair protein)
MADVVSAAVRSRMMAGVRGKNTQPEIAVRSALFREGFRFRIHDKRLPGRPDIVLKAHRAVIFVHGCFWHLHKCALFKWPKTNPEFWRTKITRNRSLDRRAVNALKKRGWRVLTVWECALKRKDERQLETVFKTVVSWLNSERPSIAIAGPPGKRKS